MNGGIRLRTRIAALLAATAAIGFGTTAHAGNAGTGNESIAVSPSTVAAGADVTVAGAGWFCAADVDVAIEGGGSTTVSWAEIANGGFVITLTAPELPGDYNVVAEYGFAQTSVSCEGLALDSFTVVPAPTTVAPTTTTAPTTSAAPTTSTAPTTQVTTTTAAPTTSGAPTTTAASTTTEAPPQAPTIAPTTTVVGGAGPTTTTGASGGGPVSTLPVTGGTGGTMSASALLVLALGAVLVIAARRNTAA